MGSFIFLTDWGWSALDYGDDWKLKRVFLPGPGPEGILKKLGSGCQEIGRSHTPTPAGELAERVQAYYRGHIIRDWQVRLDLSGFTPFLHSIWRETSRIPYGETTSYGNIARAINNPRACQAVGQALSRNPWPLIIPCHRVLAAHGPGGFTGPGGVSTKKKMLDMEKESVKRVAGQA
ncbi:MAG TPA: methylated-DNA--[protein]-cysteine S-methyltransferase [Syntrophomonadaceae bacterium]|nr:methylated-DNA--[protein]-cysteine S-methyltransferase [Syntrophomonadaceae bacterium]